MSAFEDIYEVGNYRASAAPEQVRALEAKLGCVFPADHLEFITTLGAGDLNNLLRIRGPEEIAERTDFLRGLARNNFWDHPDSVLSADEIASCIYLADTMYGDNIVFSMERKSEVFLLPHDDMLNRMMGRNFREAIDWVCKSGAYFPSSNYLYFNAWTNRLECRFAGASEFLYSRMKETVLGFGLHDVAHDQEEGREAGVLMFIKSFGGEIEFHRKKEGLFSKIAIQYDAARADDPALTEFINRLKALGFRCTDGTLPGAQ